MSKPVFSTLLRFSGRRNRKSFLLVQLLIFFALFVLFAALVPAVTDPPELGSLLEALLVVSCMVPSLISIAQRAQDFGWSGWSVLLIFVPIVGVAFWFALFFIPGTRGPNRYGPDPLVSLAEAA